MRNSRPRLIIFAKAPYPGGAKTRLAAGVGKVHANRLYRAMCRKILRNVEDPRWDTYIAVSPDSAATQHFGEVWPKHIPQILQGSGSLSPRLARIFAHKGITLVIGTDAPQIRVRDVAQAINLLKSHKAVFGPADDGGFWLMGMRGPCSSDIFDGVNWSTDRALADITKNIGEPVARLRVLIDVDNVAALKQLRRN